ncbi:MAG: VWA-like domain-containing protein [Rhodobacteraceae bacterium]|uniref:vWA domain-containing protein n=1 Tax=Marivita sp. TaxID=2003365 RepID=UPI003B517175|nr:VWA-like domain-containing protein [Paracoccaceae bacterium]
MSRAHSRRARPALAQMGDIDPAIAALALWCMHRDHDGQTETDGDTIYYGPSFTHLSPPEQIGLAAHHVLHVALRHSARQSEMATRLGRDFKPKLYSLAADAMINEALLSGGHALPRPAVRAKELIELLPGIETVAPNILADWDTDRLYHALAAPLEGDPSQVNPAVEDYMIKRKFAPDVNTKGSFDTQSDVWASRIEQALELGRSAGVGIGAALIRFGDLPSSVVPWERHLRRLLLKAVSDVPRLSHKRPAARWVAQDAMARAVGAPAPAFQPGSARDLRRPQIVVALDTSSSVTDMQLDLFVAEVLAIQRRSDAEVHLWGFDTGLHSQLRLDQADALDRLEVRRGGGTDFAPVFDASAKMQPSLLIVLTDLDAPAPPAPRHPVIWAVPSPVPRPPRFGTLLVMNR